MASPQLAMANYGGGGGGGSSITPPSSIPFSRTAGYLNDSLHRHSFNESIYSEPYSGRYAQPSYSRYDASRMNPLCESASASNLIGRTTTNQRPRPVIPFVAQIHASSSQRDVYGTQSSITSQYTTTDAGSTRSSIYSDKTILNDITPPSTPPLRPIATNPKTANASNASGSQRTQATKPINQGAVAAVQATTPPTTKTTTKTTTTTTAIIETAPTNALNVDKVTIQNVHTKQLLECLESNGSTAPVMRRPKNKDSNSNSNSAVRRISYLRATANDIAEHSAETSAEMSASGSVQESSQSGKGKECDRNEDLQLFREYMRYAEHFSLSFNRFP